MQILPSWNTSIVTGTELKSLLLAQADYHNQRARQTATLAQRARAEYMRALADPSVRATSSAKRDYFASSRSHKATAAKLRFVANHIDLHGQYTVNYHDLDCIGVTREPVPE